MTMMAARGVLQRYIIDEDKANIRGGWDGIRPGRPAKATEKQLGKGIHSKYSV